MLNGSLQLWSRKSYYLRGGSPIILDVRGIKSFTCSCIRYWVLFACPTSALLSRMTNRVLEITDSVPHLATCKSSSLDKDPIITFERCCLFSVWRLIQIHCFCLYRLIIRFYASYCVYWSLRWELLRRLWLRVHCIFYSGGKFSPNIASLLYINVVSFRFFLIRS